MPRNCFYLLVLLLIVFQSSCGQRRIKDGKEVKSDKRYVVYLLKATSSIHHYYGWLCGGAIISKDYVLTSAACVQDVEHLYVIPGYKTYVPAAKIKSDNCIKQKKKKVVLTCVPKSYEFDFEKTELWSKVDIAVVKIESPFDFNDKSYEKVCSYIPQPIHYNIDKDFPKTGDNVIVFGWGHNKEFRKDQELVDLNQATLQYASTTVLDEEICVSHFQGNKDLASFIASSMICTLMPGNTDETGNPVLRSADLEKDTNKTTLNEPKKEASSKEETWCPSIGDINGSESADLSELEYLKNIFQTQHPENNILKELSTYTNINATTLIDVEIQDLTTTQSNSNDLQDQFSTTFTNTDFEIEVPATTKNDVNDLDDLYMDILNDEVVVAKRRFIHDNTGLINNYNIKRIQRRNEEDNNSDDELEQLDKTLLQDDSTVKDKATEVRSTTEHERNFEAARTPVVDNTATQTGTSPEQETTAVVDKKTTKVETTPKETTHETTSQAKIIRSKEVKSQNDTTKIKEGNYTPGICQNDHGGPLVAWKDGVEILVAVATLFKLDDEQQCMGPYLFTKTWSNAEFIQCIVDENNNDPSLRSCDEPEQVNFKIERRQISWVGHRDGPADNEPIQYRQQRPISDYHPIIRRRPPL